MTIKFNLSNQRMTTKYSRFKSVELPYLKRIGTVSVQKQKRALPVPRVVTKKRKCTTSRYHKIISDRPSTNGKDEFTP
jgi:hypothetical protein